ncbi:MAG: AMP-binding protein [Arenibacterium sp.]
MTATAYQDFLDSFDIATLDQAFAGDFATGLNVCTECCDRHAEGDRVALNWVAKDGTKRTVSFAELRAQSARFANLLVAQGIKPGDRVAGLLPRTPDLLVVILGTLRAGAVYQPLFTAFGPKAIEQRLQGPGARLGGSDAAKRSKLDEVAQCPPIATIGAAAPGDIDFTAEMARQPEAFEPVPRQADDLFLMMFTSGTTGAPKGVGVPLKALRAIRVYMTCGIGLTEQDRYWNIADPGWAYGLYYAVIGPLLLGQATTFQEDGFSVEQTCALIRDLQITNFAAAPTVYRLLIAGGADVAGPLKGQLRVASSAGEPLNAEVIAWFRDHLDCPLKDHYGQTEMGMVMMNHHGLSHAERGGSAGIAMPGHSLAIVDETGQPQPANTPGILAVDREHSPLFFFPGYWGREGQDWVGKWYLTGDTVEQDQNGFFSFVGRSDDLISSAGYRIGPFDVESSLIEHRAVLESAVVGKPDKERGHIVKAFVVLGNGHEASDDLSEELRLYVRNRLGAHAYPREISFVSELPKTPSGKIQRFLLRQQV